MTTISPIKKELDRSARRGFITSLEGSRRGFITNYPNVTQWKTLEEESLQAPEPLNIYVHIPFCAQQCSYCYYRIITGANKSKMDRYTNAICKDLTMASDRYHLHERPIKTIYIGGGDSYLIAKIPSFTN